MPKIHPKQAHGLAEKADETGFRNHFAGLAAYPAEVRDEISRWGLTRVAGNVFECRSTKDFWAVKGGTIMKLVGNEVDAGESIPGAPGDKPAAFLANILDDLEF